MSFKKIWDKALRDEKKIEPHRLDRKMKAILYGDVPTFMELPHVRMKEDLITADVVF